MPHNQEWRNNKDWNNMKITCLAYPSQIARNKDIEINKRKTLIAESLGSWLKPGKCGHMAQLKN